MSNTEEQLSEIRKEAEEYAGSHYTRNHYPKNWNDRYQSYIAGRTKTLEDNARLRSLCEAAEKVMDLERKLPQRKLDGEQSFFFAQQDYQKALKEYESLKKITLKALASEPAQEYDQILMWKNVIALIANSRRGWDHDAKELAKQYKIQRLEP